jgi:hypothetical protein
VKVQYADCRVLIFASETSTQDLLEKARDEGLVFDVMPKPVQPEDLLTWAKVEPA